MTLAKRFAGTLFGIALALGVALGMAASAEAAYATDYVQKSWNGSSVVSTTKSSSCSTITDDTEYISGWWAVTGNVSSDERLVVQGTANIVL